MTDTRAIGIFDSGIGGLTVLAALRDRLPHESFLYLGDTARLPYGTKSQETVVRYALRAAAFLAGRDIKMLVVACNTASSFALEVLEEALPFPVVGVVRPGARAAAAHARRRVGVAATESTVASGAYVRALHALRPDLEVVPQACPLFVPLAEEGWLDHPVTRDVARIYMQPVVDAGVDTLILGCTHYPLLRPAIAAALGPGVHLVDSAEAAAADVAAVLAEHDLLANGAPGRARLTVTDSAARFGRIARLILGGEAALELVDLA